MIAVSSHAPHERSFEVAQNQITAARSWQQVFKGIMYLGPIERSLSSQVTGFLRADDYPTIATLARVCASQTGLACLLNSDIELAPDAFRAVQRQIEMTHPRYAFSFRWERSAGSLRRTDDLGLDIFIAPARVWVDVANNVPPTFRIGHGGWDNWIHTFLGRLKPTYNFTPARCVIHPRHGHRVMPHARTVDTGCLTEHRATP